MADGSETSRAARALKALRNLAWTLALALAAGSLAYSAIAAPMTYAQFGSRPQPKAKIHIPYGSDPSQFAELWLPTGPGPHPTVVMIHGGCWQASVASLRLMNLVSDDLRKRGIAVWNIEYRRVDQPGGGYPGTFQDVGAAIDALRGQARKYNLRLDPLVAVGHSSGGHLALWAAARPKLPPGSPLRAGRPLAITSVVSLGGLADLQKMLEPGSHQGCGPEPILELVGHASAKRPDVFSDTSPAEAEPFSARQISVHGSLDKIAPVAIGKAYTEKAQRAGAPAELRVIKGAGHFELIAPGGPAWDEIAALITGLAEAPASQESR